jgi:hypothetical protein
VGSTCAGTRGLRVALTCATYRGHLVERGLPRCPLTDRRNARAAGRSARTRRPRGARQVRPRAGTPWCRFGSIGGPRRARLEEQRPSQRDCQPVIERGMAFLEEEAQLAFAKRGAGQAYPMLTWLVVLGELDALGYATDDELTHIPSAVVRDVVRRLAARDMPLTRWFVDKVIASRLARDVVPFGPAVSIAAGLAGGAGARTLCLEDKQFIANVLDVYSRNGISLSLLDTCAMLSSHRGVSFSPATLSRYFKEIRFSKKIGQPRSYLKYTEENMAYTAWFVRHVFHTFVVAGN